MTWFGVLGGSKALTIVHNGSIFLADSVTNSRFSDHFPTYYPAHMWFHCTKYIAQIPNNSYHVNNCVILTWFGVLGSSKAQTIVRNGFIFLADSARNICCNGRLHINIIHTYVCAALRRFASTLRCCSTETFYRASSGRNSTASVEHLRRRVLQVSSRVPWL